MEQSSREASGVSFEFGGGHVARTLRDRHIALVRSADRATPANVEPTLRRLVQIFDGGSMSSSPDHFFLAHPIEFDGTEIEGGLGSPNIDSCQTIVVDVIGASPSAGEILSAYMIGGRWVAERGGNVGNGSLACAPCSIPKKNLTVSWTNSLSGNGSTALIYTPSPLAWASPCSNGLQFALLCTANQVEFRVKFWVTGTCPGPGNTQFCSNLRPPPYGLTMSSYSCSPFSMTLQPTSSTCQTVTSSGYTQFTITL